MSGCTHPHEEISGDNIGTCILCGQRRQYDPEGGTKPPVIIKEGIDFTKCDPLKIPRERKIAIARFAKEHGIPHTVECTGFPMKVIRAWVGTYTRVQKEKPGPKLKPRKELLVVDRTQGRIIKIFAGPLLTCGLCEEAIVEAQPLYIDTNMDARLWLHRECGQRLAKVLGAIGVSFELNL